MEVRLLGPVELWSREQEVALGNPHRRCVLAALAMTPGTPVGIGALVDRVWGECLPGRVRSVLYTHVSRLRAALEQADPAGGRAVLQRAADGYVLGVDPVRVDLHQARRLAVQARAAAATDLAGDEQAAQLLAEACALWRATPLAGLSGDWVERVRVGLRYEHLALYSDRFHVELGLGRHSAAVAPLADLLAANPTVESLASLLMVALYRSGQQAAALEVYTQLRRRLREEIGDEPGLVLRRLHEQVLRRDPGLDYQPIPGRARRRRPLLRRGRRGACRGRCCRLR